MKHLIAVLSAAVLTAFLLGSCSSKDASVASENSPAGLTEGGASSVDSQANKGADKSSKTESAEAQSAETETAAKDEETDGVKKDEKPDTEGVEQKNVKLIVKDQKTAGQIVVQQVSTSRDGWISIHKSQADGSIELPKDIGEARVDAGDNEDVIVDLWETPAIGDELWVLLHIDAGDRGTYEFPEKDLPVKKNGETVARSFVIKRNEAKKDDAE